MSAELTALQTLREHCSPEQARALDAHEPLEIIAPSGGRYFLTLAATHVQVQGVVGSLSRAVVGSRTMPPLPPGDLALLAKLLIENAEASWLAAARCCGNVWVLVP